MPTRVSGRVARRVADPVRRARSCDSDGVGSAVEIAIGALAGLVVLWVVVGVLWMVVRPPTSSARDAVRLVPDVIRLTHRLARDPLVGRASRIRLFLLLGYLATPIDLVPDVLPVIGYADDAVMIAIVIRGVVRRAGLGAVRRHWPGTDASFDLLVRLCRLDRDASQGSTSQDTTPPGSTPPDRSTTFPDGGSASTDP